MKYKERNEMMYLFKAMFIMANKTQRDRKKEMFKIKTRTFLTNNSFKN